MQAFIQTLINGVITGSIYALIALGYTMVYGVLKLLNFAHGDVYMVGAFIGYGIITVFGGPFALTVNVVLMLVLMFGSAMLGCGLLGVLIERFAYRRLRTAPLQELQDLRHAHTTGVEIPAGEQCDGAAHASGTVDVDFLSGIETLFDPGEPVQDLLHRRGMGIGYG